MSRFTKLSLLLALCLSVANVSADELGRLFFTSEQRSQLDLEQVQPLNSNDLHNILSVNGIVQKNGGERIAWINGVPQAIGESNLQSPASVPITIPGQTQPVKIKVGQKILIRPAIVDTK